MILKRRNQNNKESIDELLECFLEYRRKIITKKEFENQWENVRSRYSIINLYKCNFSSIGETVPILFNIIEDFEEQNDNNTLNLVLPSFYSYYHGDLCNKRLLDIFGSKIHFIDGRNIDFWSYVIKNHRIEINTKEIDKYKSRRATLIDIRLGECKIGFSKDQEIEAERKMSKMGIDREFVCILARQTNHKEMGFGKAIAREFSVYTCDLTAFGKTARYLGDRGIQVVRMGKYENEECNLANVIDYANNYYDELMDFYLASKCKFIVDSGGFGAVAPFWGRPLLYINAYGLNYGAESFPDTGKDMMILQKVWSERKKRYLTLMESLDLFNVCDLHLSNYEKRGIKLIKNTEEELYSAVVEMNQKVDGVWEESEDERMAVKKFQNIMNIWREKHDFVWTRRREGAKGYQMMPYRICWNYLKNNMYLLDE